MALALALAWMILGSVPVSWRSSVEVFDRLLRRHGVDSDAVVDVHAAWAAFVEFLQTPLGGIMTGEDSDADGFIVQWGRWSWNDHCPSLSFTRQLAIPETEDSDWQPSYWQVELEMTFPDLPSLTGLDELNESDTGFSFEPIGPARAAELAATRDHYLALYPQLGALFSTAPANSALSLQQVD
jgi:hypothetical protein